MVKLLMGSVDSSSSSNDDHSSSFSTNNNNNLSSSTKMFKGVRKRKWGKWVTEIRLPNSRERIWLGSYDTQEKAARAFDAALYCLRGKNANFNFPNTPNNLQEIINVVLPHQHSLSPQEIQEVAAKFANKESDGTQLEEPQQSHEQESNKSNNTSEDTTTIITTSSSIFNDNNNVNDGSMQVDQGEWDTMDWTFFNMLDDLNNGNDFGLYFGPDKMHPGEFLCSTQAPLLFDGSEIDEGIVDHDAFSNPSFLWSWNF